jgi:hypothetical protein
MQERTIDQRRKEAGVATCISDRFGTGGWVKLNSNVVLLNL